MNFFGYKVLCVNRACKLLARTKLKLETIKMLVHYGTTYIQTIYIIHILRYMHFQYSQNHN